MPRGSSYLTTTDAPDVATRSEERYEGAGSWLDPPAGRCHLVVAPLVTRPDGRLHLRPVAAVPLARTAADLIRQPDSDGWQQCPGGHWWGDARSGRQAG